MITRHAATDGWAGTDLSDPLRWRGFFFNFHLCVCTCACVCVRAQPRLSPVKLVSFFFEPSPCLFSQLEYEHREAMCTTTSHACHTYVNISPHARRSRARLGGARARPGHSAGLTGGEFTFTEHSTRHSAPSGGAITPFSLSALDLSLADITGETFNDDHEASG